MSAPDARDVIADEDTVKLSDAVYDRLSGHFGDFNGTNADWAVEAVLDALTAAGFAVVKLPEPDMTGEHVWNETESHPVANYFADGCDEWVMSCCGQVDVNGLPPNFSPTYARNLAARLLAAASHAEAKNAS